MIDPYLHAKFRITDEKDNPLYQDIDKSKDTSYKITLFANKVVTDVEYGDYTQVPDTDVDKRLIKSRTYEKSPEYAEFDIPWTLYYLNKQGLDFLVQPKTIYDQVRRQHISWEDLEVSHDEPIHFTCVRLFPYPDEEWETVDYVDKEKRNFVPDKRHFGNNNIILQWSSYQYMTLQNIEKASYSLQNNITDKNIGYYQNKNMETFSNTEPAKVEVEGMLGPIYSDGNQISNRDEQLRKLYDLANNKRPFVFYSDFAIFEDAIISNISVSQDESTSNYSVSLGIKEIDFYEPTHMAIQKADHKSKYNEVRYDPPTTSGINGQNYDKYEPPGYWDRNKDIIERGSTTRINPIDNAKAIYNDAKDAWNWVDKKIPDWGD